jgi:hypothetical protein
MALGAVRVLATVSGDAEVAAFYEQIAFDRGYGGMLPDADIVVLGMLTDFSNVNMTHIALFNVLHFETDPDLIAAATAGMEGLWAEGEVRGAWHYNSAWYNVLQAASRPVDDAVIEGALDNLRGFRDPPYFNDEVVNCDEDEIPTGTCLAIDGETLIEIFGEWEGDTFVPTGMASGDPLVATTFVPQHVRPPSNFEWRSSPYRLNGGGTTLLNPGGDFRAAYWAGRYLTRSR